MKRYYEVLLAEPTVQAIRAIHAHDPVAAKLVVDSLEYLSADVGPGARQTIDQAAGLARVTVGDFDALCWIRPEELTIIILTISGYSQPA